MEKARQTLPRFFARLANPEPGDSGFLVKISYVTSDGQDTEYIWAGDVAHHGDTVSATIDNVP